MNKGLAGAVGFCGVLLASGAVIWLSAQAIEGGPPACDRLPLACVTMLGVGLFLSAVFRPVATKGD